jgi:diadenosine tetraphosphate (Ap4A) HIT family hydrolase
METESQYPLDPRLETSTAFIMTLTLCQVRLSKNSAFPWVLLVPTLDSIGELTDLSPSNQHVLMDEISLVSIVMNRLFSPDKLNVATLGNVVAQLHVHIIARYRTDPAWPNPVWNTIEKTYSPSDLEHRVNQIRQGIKVLQS